MTKLRQEACSNYCCSIHNFSRQEPPLRITMEEISKPDLCMLDADACSKIVAWGKVALEYQVQTQIVVDMLISVFESRRQMELAGQEIKYYLRGSLSEEDQSVLNRTEDFLGTRNQTPEQKDLIKTRNKIINRVKSLFKRLLDEAFPSMIPMMAVTYNESPASSTRDLEESMASVSLSNPSVERTLESDFAQQSPIDEQSSVDQQSGRTTEDVTTVDDVSSNKTESVVPQPSRPKFGKRLPTNETDLFETSEELLQLLEDYLPNIKHEKLTVFEPCHGNGAITNFLEGRGINVVARDKYTMDESHDFLTEPIPSGVDVIITNPPFNLKFEMLAKMMEHGKMFILLLPFETATTKTFHTIVGNIKFDLVIPIGRSRFLHAGKIRDVGATAWYVFSPAATGQMTFKQLGKEGDIELGSQDTEGERGYDTDEHSQEVRDEAILNDPATEFTTEGYVKEGFVVDDQLEDGDEDDAEEDEDCEEEEVDDGMSAVTGPTVIPPASMVPKQVIIRIRRPKVKKAANVVGMDDFLTETTNLK